MKATVHPVAVNRQMIFFYAMNRPALPVLYYTIDKTTLKRFLFFDIILGTTLYYAVKVVSAGTVVATVGCIIGTEGAKRLRWQP